MLTEFDVKLYNQQEYNIISEYITSSKLRTLLVAIFNFAIRLIEMFYQILISTEDYADEEKGWDYYTSFFVIRIIPVILGVELLFAVLKNHYAGCITWCLVEMGIILSYLGILCMTSTNTEMWEDSDITLYMYCLLRVVSIKLIYDFTVHITEQDIYQEKVDKILLRNHFWYQLSLLHREKNEGKVEECNILELNHHKQE